MPVVEIMIIADVALHGWGTVQLRESRLTLIIAMQAGGIRNVTSSLFQSLFSLGFTIYASCVSCVQAHECTTWII